MPKINRRLLRKFQNADLSRGSHFRWEFEEERQACFMEWASVLAGEEFSDNPSCTDRLISRYVIHLNDGWEGEQRQSLKPFVRRVIGTNDGRDVGDLAIRWAYGATEEWLRATGFDLQATKLAQNRSVGVCQETERVAAGREDALWRALVEELIPQAVAEADLSPGRAAGLKQRVRRALPGLAHDDPSLFTALRAATSVRAERTGPILDAVVRAVRAHLLETITLEEVREIVALTLRADHDGGRSIPFYEITNMVASRGLPLIPEHLLGLRDKQNAEALVLLDKMIRMEES